MFKQIKTRDANYKIEFYNLANISQKSRILITGAGSSGKTMTAIDIINKLFPGSRGIILTHIHNHSQYGKYLVSPATIVDPEYDIFGIDNNYDYIVVDELINDNDVCDHLDQLCRLDKFIIVISKMAFSIPNKIKSQLDYLLIHSDNSFINHIKIHEYYMHNTIDIDILHKLIKTIAVDHNMLVIDKSKNNIFWSNTFKHNHEIDNCNSEQPRDIGKILDTVVYENYIYTIDKQVDNRGSINDSDYDSLNGSGNMSLAGSGSGSCIIA